MKNIKKNVTIKSKVKLKDNEETPFNIEFNYSEEYDSFNIRVKKGEGFMSYTDSLQGLPLEVVQKLNEMLEEVLVKAGSEYEKKEHKMSNESKVDTKLTKNEIQKIAEETANALGSEFSVTKGSVDVGTFDLDYEGVEYDGGTYLVMDNGDVVNVALRERPISYNYKTKKKYEFGGDFQAGVYAKGGSLKEHGIEIGDTFVKTISGNIQKIKDKNGKIVYVDLSTGERDAQPPLPFNDGGGLQDEVYIKYLNKDKKFKEDIKYFKSYDEARKWGRENLENFNSDMINFKFENGGGIGIKEDIDLTDDKRLRVGKPAMPTRKLSNQEIAEKYNASAYEYMETDKKAFGGNLFSSAKKMVAPPMKYPKLEGKQVFLKNGKMVQVLTQYDDNLSVIEVGKLGSGVRPNSIKISEVETSSYKMGGALVGNQKRIDMNKNGKIDAEDFKLLRSSMNGAWRNERKHVNHDEDYEVRYARKKPSRTGYKGKRKFGEGGGISNFEIGDTITIIKPFPNADMTGKKGKVIELTKNNTGVIYISIDGKRIAVSSEYIRKDKKFATGGGISNFERLSRVVAKNYEGKPVKPKYQKEYGKTYSKSEAKQVGNRVAGKVKKMQKAESGAEVKKGNRGGVMVLAKKIRKEGESWKDALKRAGEQMK